MQSTDEHALHINDKGTIARCACGKWSLMAPTIMPYRLIALNHQTHVQFTPKGNGVPKGTPSHGPGTTPTTHTTNRSTQTKENHNG